MARYRGDSGSFSSHRYFVILLHDHQRAAYISGNRRFSMADANEPVKITANLPKELFDALVELANKRGVSANTVLQEAVAREKYFSDKEASGASILIEEKDKSFKKVLRK
jgi:hypothetical protein